MRILHTSDWHIGQRFHGLEREEEHQLFFNWLLRFIKEQAIDTLLISGDIFDVGYPSNVALKQYYRFLNEVNASVLKRIIITGGNHDHISTLDAPKELLSSFSIDVIGGATEEKSDEILPLYSDSCEVNAVVLAVPFLRDKDIRQAVAGESYEDKALATRGGIAKHYSELVALAQEQYGKDVAIIAMGHFVMHGVSSSDSEREIHIGNLASMTLPELPDAINYWAMGHIHRAQIIGGQESVRYCGSPIPLSFSERADQKQVIVVDIEEAKLTNIVPVDVPCFRPLRRITGTIEECEEALSTFHYEGELQAWVEVNATEEFHDPALINRFEKVLESFQEEAKFSIIRHTLRFENQISGTAQLLEETRSLNEMEVSEVFETLIQRGEFENGEQLQQTFTLLREWMDQ